MTKRSADTERPLTISPVPPDVAQVMESPLLRTKLHIPRLGSTLLPRPRLTDRLALQPNGYLTLVTAPAGYGKTTLVVDWVRQHGQPVAWLTLDEQDNDPIIFWRYLMAALRGVDNRLGMRSQTALNAPGPQAAETAIVLLINDIVAHIAPETPLTLVLDDFHWIHSAAIFQNLNFLVQHQPPQLHLILLTRADPPLSLARLRVEGRLLELRAADLRLTAAEIDSLLNDVLALNVTAETIGRLADETEGWIAGLQLVALTMRRGGAPDSLHASAGARRHIFAYLMEEVLRRQPEEVRSFLQQTAVLRQLCGPLCAAVTGDDQAEHLLHQLAADELFVTPLDDQGQWYRYHPLFAEMLRAGLDEVAQRECHRRAARWYAGQQLLQDAMRNAQSAQDFDFMAQLLTETYKHFLAHGLLVSLKKWLTALPAEYLTPRLRLACAWCRVYESNEAELQEIVAEIESRLPEMDDAFQGEIMAVQAVYASLYGRLDKAIELATLAIPLIDPQDQISLAAAYQALGNAYRYQGELDAAVAAYSMAMQKFEEMGAVFMSQLPLYRMAHVRIMQGRLREALRTYQLAQSRAQAAGHEPLIAIGELFGHLSSLYREWNELEQAESYAQQEVELARAGQMFWPLVDGYLKLASVQAARGAVNEAREAMALANEAGLHLKSRQVTARIALHQARHELEWGNLPAAASWGDEYRRGREAGQEPFTPLMDLSAEVLLARIRLVQGNTEEAHELLQDVQRQAEATGRVRLVVEASILLALAQSKLKRTGAAQKTIIRALSLAQPEGYMRVFIENEPALATLLAQVRHLFPDYVAKLLNAMTVEAGRPGEPPLDALTDREREILSLIAHGQSNQQIADTLFITVGTVKGHINHILSKLDVQSRTHALARARELGLLE